MALHIDQFLVIMMVAVIVAIVAKYIRWPYTIVLLISGLVIAYFNVDPPFVLDKDMIFHILLPPLIFEGALHMRLKHLKENAKVISLLAIPALIISSFFVGWLIYLFTNSFMASALTFPIALLIAVIIIPTDPVSILAIYKDTKIPTKLKNIIEGESIFDDGTCLVLFAVILDLIRSGNLDLMTGIVDFLRMAIFGILLGLAVGYILFLIISKIDDKFTEVMITLIMVFGLFAMAENMGASGVFAVVMAGLILGNYGTRFAMTPSARHTLLSFWGFIVFLVNSFLFIVVGMNVDLGAVWNEIELVIFCVLALWFARGASIYLIGIILNKKGASQTLPRKWQAVMWWGGLRGAIPIALALSIPLTLDDGTLFPHRDMILAITFGVVLITLLVQGLSLKTLIGKLGFHSVSKKEAEKEEREIATLLKDTVDELIQLKEDGEISNAAYEWLIHRYGQANSQLLTELGLLVQEHGFIPREEYTYSVKETLEAKKESVKEAWEKNLIKGSVGERLLSEIDFQIQTLAVETEGSSLRTPTDILKSVTVNRANNGSQTDLETNCAICMNSIGDGCAFVKCRCGTTFHQECSDDTERCPVCIAPLGSCELK